MIKKLKPVFFSILCLRNIPESHIHEPKKTKPFIFCIASKKSDNSNKPFVFEYSTAISIGTNINPHINDPRIPALITNPIVLSTTLIFSNALVFILFALLCF